MSSEQDWETRVIKKDQSRQTDEEKIKSGKMAKLSKANPNKPSTILSSKITNDFDPENISAPVKITMDLKLAIQQARNAKDMTQTDLDKACNFPSGTTKDYENGKAVIKPLQLDKMNTVLKVKLPRPKKSKPTKTK